VHLILTLYRHLLKGLFFKPQGLFFACCLFPFVLFAQTPEAPATTTEQQLENITENNEDAETEDDSYLQQMQQYIKNPINLNAAGENELKQLRLLNPIQIQSLIRYRNLFGAFVNIYELQAIPLWDIGLIQRIRPFVSVAENTVLFTTVKDRLRRGDHSVLVRLSQILEQSKGYLADSASNFYPGSPQKLLVRYKYQFKNLLQYGILAEKDAGEQFFKGKQRQGFDFYSIHFFAKEIGIIKSLALGDFTVNLGQGLTQWQSLAFKKSSDAISIKREAPVLRPYNSAGEINFHRGAGITIEKGKLQATIFTSYKKIDANLVADTTQSQEDFVSSLQTSGYHRTKSETDDKGIQQQLAFGGNAAYKHRSLHIGVNVVQYNFKLPLIKSGDSYNLYALSGKSVGNYSFDYSYTHKNIHIFGEAAVTNKLHKAFINGILISTSADVDMSFLYRNISKAYQSLYASAFTENTYPTNESGFYAGVAIHPGSTWRVDVYADFYEFPWLKFRVDAPSYGADYLLQLTYKPGKKAELYSRFRTESKAINANPDQLNLSPVAMQSKQSWRTQITCNLNQDLILGSRLEILWFNKKGAKPEEGFLAYLNLLYKPVLKSYSASIRVQYFETSSYNSRIYAYENDVLYSFSIPVFYDKGVRYYINANYDVNKKISLWARVAQIIYNNKNLVGSGLDEIKGNLKTEIKVQVMYKF
jgi:Helix-hairpin-helix motif